MKTNNADIESLEELAYSYLAEARHHFDQLQILRTKKVNGIVKDSAEKREREILECMLNHFSLFCQIEKIVAQESDESGGDKNDLH